MTGIRARSLKEFGIPNMLSILRLILIPVYAATMFLSTGMVAAGVLVLSGITDVLDGFIARKFHQVTELGRILDPLADKLTQATVCICLVIRQPALVWLLGIFILKEAAMIAAGANIIRKGREMISSRWFGKLSTVIFYVVMIVIIAWKPTLQADYVLIVISLGFMLFSFIRYVRIFLRLVGTHGREGEKS